MKSKIQESIVANEKILHNGQIEAKKLYEIAEKMEISIQKLGNMFQLKEMAKSKIRSQKGKVIVKLYTLYELQEIKQQVRNEYQHISEIDYRVIKNIKNKYKIGNNEIRSFFNINYNQLKKLEKDKKYRIENTIGKETKKKERIEKYRYKAYITEKDIQDIKKEDTISIQHIAKLFHVPIEKIKSLEKRKIKKVRIYLYTKQDKEKTEVIL